MHRQNSQEYDYSSQQQSAQSSTASSTTSTTTTRYSGTSSAFSANANPNEDWTKISDLAERRRIQNRIAQRNYRKKLKKRLEDLERRAGSSSASPEQRPAELHQAAPRRKSENLHTTRRNSALAYPSQGFSSETTASQFLSPPQSHQLFSQQVTRQLSTSPPPFTYPTYAAEPLPLDGGVTFSQIAYSQFPATSADFSLYGGSYAATPTPPPSFVPLPTATYQYVKPDMYSMAGEIDPLTVSFAPMASIDATAANLFTDTHPHTPPLLEAFELSSGPESPPDSFSHPLTPPMASMTPNLLLADDILSHL